MSKYYTNITRFGSKLLVKGYDDGRYFKERVDFEPTLYVTDKSGESPLRSLDGKTIKPMSFHTMSEAKQFIDKYNDVQGFDLYGNSAWIYQYISHNWEGEIKWKIDQLKIFSIDIETTVEHKMTIPQVMADPKEKIQLISVQDKTTKEITVFSYRDFTIDKKVTKVICRDERDLLEKFILFFANSNVDVVTGWNTKHFDLPYIVKRSERVFGGEEFIKNLSPWKTVNLDKVEIMNKWYDEVDILGVASLDYLELYKKYIKDPRESYKLDNIAYVELGKNKIKNPTPSFYGFYTGEFDITSENDIQDEYKELHTYAWKRYQFKERLKKSTDADETAKLEEAISRLSEKISEMSWNIFCLYNIIDTELVDQLEDKMKLIELQITLAYFAKVNYEDIFGQVKVWETIIYNHLRDSNRMPPIKSMRSFKGDKFEGAYVKDPIVGKHKYIASFDLDSLYPHLIMQYNISPETLLNTFNHFRDMSSVEKFLNKEIDTSLAKERNYSLTANGVCYTREKQGFLPELMESYYASRKAHKKEMLKKKSENEKNPSPALEYEISRLDNLQMALKILLNSLYGASGNQGFKYFDLRIAEGITLSGQLSIRWIANKFNEFLNKQCGTTNEEYVVYIDTDSNYVKLERVVNMWEASEIKKGNKPTEEDKINFMDKFCDKVLQPLIEKSFEELRDYMNGFQQKMSMKRENLCDVGLWCAKKKYMLNVWDSEGVRYKEPKVKVTGLDMIKSSTPEFLRKKLKETLQIILFGTNDQLRTFITDFKSDFEKLDPTVIAKPVSINEMDKYITPDGKFAKGIPINVRAAAIYNKMIVQHDLTGTYDRIESGDKITFVYLRVPNPTGQNVIGISTEIPKEFNIHQYIDYDIMYQKSFIAPIEIMTKPLRWTVEPESSLKEFF